MYEYCSIGMHQFGSAVILVATYVESLSAAMRHITKKPMSGLKRLEEMINARRKVCGGQVIHDIASFSLRGVFHCVYDLSYTVHHPYRSPFNSISIRPTCPEQP